MTTAQRSTANRLIADKGQTVTITRRASGAYNTATGTSSITETTQTGKAVLLPLAGYRKVDGTSIVAGDETLLLSALNTAGAALTEPIIGDTLTLADGTTDYTLVEIDALNPAGLGILFDCVVRRSK